MYSFMTRERRLDFIAVFLVSAALFERKSGVLEGVARSRVAWQDPVLPAMTQS
jgi:hypothetical protein